MGLHPGPAGRTRAGWGGGSWARDPKKGVALQEKKGAGEGRLPGVVSQHTHPSMVLIPVDIYLQGLVSPLGHGP
jgi:hypothetical protein